LERKQPKDTLKDYLGCFEFYRKVFAQKKNDKNNIYSFHEKDACCIAKGKDHKPYEYGEQAFFRPKKAGFYLRYIEIIG